MIKISQSRGGHASPKSCVGGLHIVGVVLLLVMLAGSCGDNPVNSNTGNGNNNNVTPATLPGRWKFVSAQSQAFTVRSGQPTITKYGGIPTDTDVGERTTATGSFTLTNTKYNLSGTVTITAPGHVPFTKTVTATGSYSVNGSTVTLFDDESGKQTNLTALQDGNELTLIGSYQIWGITAIFAKQ